MARAKNPVHAVALATRNDGYGHIRVSVYEALGYGHATLTISCQTGGSIEGSYAWKYGVSSRDEVLKTEVLKRGFYLMRRIDRLMAEYERERGAPWHFGEYVVRVLRAARVPVVYVQPLVNASLRGDITTLPAFRPVQDHDSLFVQIQNLECKLLS